VTLQSGILPLERKTLGEERKKMQKPLNLLISVIRVTVTEATIILIIITVIIIEVAITTAIIS